MRPAGLWGATTPATVRHSVGPRGHGPARSTTAGRRADVGRSLAGTRSQRPGGRVPAAGVFRRARDSTARARSARSGLGATADAHERAGSLADRVAAIVDADSQVRPALGPPCQVARGRRPPRTQRFVRQETDAGPRGPVGLDRRQVGHRDTRRLVGRVGDDHENKVPWSARSELRRFLADLDRWSGSTRPAQLCVC